MKQDDQKKKKSTRRRNNPGPRDERKSNSSPLIGLRSSPALGEWGLWILPSALPPRKACLMLRD